jgi:hypothetical protein
VSEINSVGKCIFCGSDYLETVAAGSGTWWVRCGLCYATGPQEKTEAGSVEAFFGRLPHKTAKPTFEQCLEVLRLQAIIEIFEPEKENESD